MKDIKIGIIGGGLMGREMASAFARWCAMTDVTVRPVLAAVADLNPATLGWFDCIPSCTQRVRDYHELLANPEIDVEFNRNTMGREGALGLALTQRFPLTARLRHERAVSRAQLAAAPGVEARAGQRGVGAKAEPRHDRGPVTGEIGICGTPGHVGAPLHFQSARVLGQSQDGEQWQGW